MTTSSARNVFTREIPRSPSAPEDATVVDPGEPSTPFSFPSMAVPKRARKRFFKPKEFAASVAKQLPKSWQDRLHWWFATGGATGYGISLLLHFSVFAVASLIVVKGIVEQNTFNTTLMGGDGGNGGELSFEAPLATDLEPIGSDDQQMIEAPQLALQDAAQPQAFVQSLKLPPAVGTGPGGGPIGEAGKGRGGGGGGDGFQFRMPGGGKAVTKGSFTAWTVPEDPAPGQDYLIVIQIKLPNHIKEYPSKDLSGKVVGTDGYHQLIPGRAPEFLPLKEQQTQIAIHVPGADRLVKDMIVIESRRLKERQVLEIVF